MARRYYSSTAVETTLSGSISNSATSITVTALSGFPNTTPWTAILDADTASEELVEVTNVAGTTLTVTRGVDGTAAVSHNAGASFRHGVSARDFDEANDHVNDSTGVHGIGSGSSVVGTTDTQTLTNKTIDVASNTLTGVAPAANPTFTTAATVSANSDTAYPKIQIQDTSTGSSDEIQGALEFYAADGSSPAGASVRAQIDTLCNSNGGSSILRFLTNDGTLTTRLAIEAGGALVLGPGATNASPPSTLDVYASSGLGTDIAGSNLRFSAGRGTGAGAGGFFSVRTAPAGASGTTLATLTERFRLDANGLITGTGTSLGAWTAYTPVLGGTGWALGNGSIEGHYCQIGKIVHFRTYVQLGSTSTAGAGVATITGPVTSANRTSTISFLTDYYDSSLTTLYTGVARMDINSTTIRLRYTSATDGAVAALTTSAPFTWATGDIIEVRGTYEAS